MHYFIFFFFRHLELRAGNVFETYHFRELSTEYRFIKSKCLLRITIKVNPCIYSRHMLIISNQSNMTKRSFLAPPDERSQSIMLQLIDGFCLFYHRSFCISFYYPTSFHYIVFWHTDSKKG